MNDMPRGGMSVAPAPERRPSLTEVIIRNLNEIFERSNIVNQDLFDIERHFFGDRPANKSDTNAKSSGPDSWENQVLQRLEDIKDILNEQQETLDNISRLHK